MDVFEKAATVRLKCVHDKFLWAHIDKSVIQHRAADNATEWTVELVSGSKAIRLKSMYNLYLTATDFAYLTGLTGKKVQQSHASKADSAVEWEPIREGQHVKLKTKRGTFLRANGSLPMYRNSVTHDVPKSSYTQHWILWQVLLVKSLEEGRPVEEDSTRVPSSFEEKEPVSLSPFVSLSPYGSLSPKADLPKKPQEEVSEVEESDSEEEGDIPPSRTQVPYPAKEKEELSSRGHRNPADDRNHVYESPHLKVEQPESSHQSSSEDEEDVEEEEESPARHSQVSNVLRQREHLAHRINNHSADERGFPQRIRQAPARRHHMSYDDAENLPRLSSQRMQHKTLDDREGDPGSYLSHFDVAEQMTPRIRYPQARRHQGPLDDREKVRRIAESPPRRDENPSYDREQRQRVEQSPPRRNERFAEERERRQRTVLSPPTTPRRTDRPNGERGQRMAQSPVWTYRRAPYGREHRRSIEHESSESSSDEEQHAQRGGRSPPRRGEPRYDDEREQRPRIGEPRYEDERDQRPRGESPARREERLVEEEEHSRYPPRRRHSSFEDDENLSRRSSQRRNVRRIIFSVADEDVDQSEAVEGKDWGSFLFEGKSLQDLKEELQERTRIYEDIFICVRTPMSSKLSILKLDLPSNNGPLSVEVVRVNSPAGQALAKPHSVRTRYSREHFDR